MGGMEWTEQEKKAPSLKFSKKEGKKKSKFKKPHPEETLRFGEAALFVPGLLSINFNFKSLQTKVERSLRKSFAQVFSSQDGRR